MPVYEYRCGVCGETFEKFRRVDERHEVECCGQKADMLISAVSRPVILDYYNESIDKRITGPKQRDRLYKELDVHEVG